MPLKLVTAGALAAATALLMGGCGSANDSAAGDPGTTTAPHSSATHSATTPSHVTTPGKPSTGTPASTSSGDSGGGMAGMAMIEIKSFMYMGAMKVKPGEMVMVSNSDSEAHTLTSDQAGMFAVTVAPGKTATFDAPAKAGSYAFHCDFHADMHGMLDVS